MNKKIVSFMETVFGLILFYAAFYLFNRDTIWSGLSIGFGSVFILVGILSLLQKILIKEEKYTKLLNEKKIEKEDERNILILLRSVRLTDKIMNYVFIVLILILSVMKVDRRVIVCFGIVFIFKIILLIITSNYYSKKM